MSDEREPPPDDVPPHTPGFNPNAERELSDAVGRIHVEMQADRTRVPDDAP